LHRANQALYDLSLFAPAIQVTEQMLAAFGVTRVSDLHTQRAKLATAFSPISMDFFMHISLGLGSTAPPEKVPAGEAGRKGISCERTFVAIAAPADLQAMAKSLAVRLAEDIAEEGLAGKCITLKLKDTNFQVRPL
jgi:DNA polymerase kappa